MGRKPSTIRKKSIFNDYISSNFNEFLHLHSSTLEEWIWSWIKNITIIVITTKRYITPNKIIEKVVLVESFALCGYTLYEINFNDSTLKLV